MSFPSIYSIFCRFFPSLSSFQIQRARPKHFCKHVLQLKETFLHFKILSIKSDWVQKKISSYLFSRSLLKITYFSKSHTCVGCFGLFTKLKRCMELVFTAGFRYTFSVKMFLIKYLITFNN